MALIKAGESTETNGIYSPTNGPRVSLTLDTNATHSRVYLGVSPPPRRKLLQLRTGAKPTPPVTQLTFTTHTRNSPKDSLRCLAQE